MSNAPELKRLQDAWQQRKQELAPDECPQAGKIWEALEGSLRQPELNVVVRHMASCPACAELWRLAHAMGAMQERGAEVVQLGPQRARRMPALALAAGLVMLIGLGLLFWQWQSPPPAPPSTTSPAAPTSTQVKPEEPGAPAVSRAPSYRDNGQVSLKSLIPEAQPVPRTDCKLLWTAGPPGTRYSLRVTTAEMVRVDLADDLASPSYRVPPEVLSEFPSGTRLMWQVHAVLPGGERIASPTFFLTLE